MCLFSANALYFIHTKKLYFSFSWIHTPPRIMSDHKKINHSSKNIFVCVFHMICNLFYNFFLYRVVQNTIKIKKKTIQKFQAWRSQILILLEKLFYTLLLLNFNVYIILYYLTYILWISVSKAPISKKKKTSEPYIL